MGNLELALGSTEPVVSIKWLSRITEHWRIEADIVSDGDLIILTMISIALNLC